jgi:hypothetical protein
MRINFGENVAAPVYKTEITAVEIRPADHDTLYRQNLALTSPKNGGRSVGIDRWWTKAAEVLFIKEAVSVVNTFKKSNLFLVSRA